MTVVSRALLDKACDMDELEGRLDELEAEMLEVNGNSERLARSYSELVGSCRGSCGALGVDGGFRGVYSCAVQDLRIQSCREPMAPSWGQGRGCRRHGQCGPVAQLQRAGACGLGGNMAAAWMHWALRVQAALAASRSFTCRRLAQPPTHLPFTPPINAPILPIGGAAAGAGEGGQLL